VKEGRDPQGNHELTIFNQFVVAAKLAVSPNSIQKRQSPEPDILCSTDGRGDMAFELVEIIDESMARRDSDATRLRELLVGAFKSLPDDRHASFLSRYQHCSIYVSFQDEAAYRRRADAVPAILDLLLSSAESITGTNRFAEYREDYEKVYRHAEFARADDHVRVVFPQYRRSPLFLIKNHSPLLGTVDWLNVSRYEHLQGPLFGVDATGSFGEPALEAVQKKFEKKYTTDAPIELLAFYESQPVLPEDIWLPAFSSFVEQNIASSPFGKIYVFDAAKNKILFQFSRPEIQPKVSETVETAYWELTEESNALDYLEMAVRSLMDVEKNPWAWKWVCISLHGSLYGFAVCAIKGTDYMRVTKTDGGGRLKLINFDTALKRCQEDGWMKQYVFSQTLTLTADQKEAVDILKNEIRNKVAHFIPGSSFIELHGLPTIVATYFDIIEFLAAESGNPHLRHAEKERVRALCEAGRKLALSTKIQRENSD